MNDRILLIGDDPNLQTTRALLLTEWFVETATGNTAIERLASTDVFTAVIVSQTVNPENAGKIVLFAKKLQPPPRILVIRDPDETFAAPSDVQVVTWYVNPRWLIGWVEQAVGRSVNLARTDK